MGRYKKVENLLLRHLNEDNPVKVSVIYLAARDNRGLTLVELMIVLVLSMLLMAAVFMTYHIQNTTSSVQHEIAAIQQDLRAVCDIMVTDIRHAGCDPTISSTAGIIFEATGPVSISISMDLNDDGDTGDANEQVSFTRSGSKILRNGISLVQNVTTFGITYYDSSNTAITPTDNGGANLTASEADNVRDVEINIRIQSNKIDPDLGTYISRTMAKRIKLRNQGL